MEKSSDVGGEDKFVLAIQDQDCGQVVRQVGSADEEIVESNATCQRFCIKADPYFCWLVDALKWKMP